MASVRLRLFASAREAAGCASDTVEAASLGEALDLARGRYGEGFAAVLAQARVWINGDEPSDGDATALADDDEVAVLCKDGVGVGRIDDKQVLESRTGDGLPALEFELRPGGVIRRRDCCTRAKWGSLRELVAGDGIQQCRFADP